MKTYFYSLLAVVLSFLACEGPVGPQGPRGNDGIDGVDGEEGFTFEYVIDFEVGSDGFEKFLTFPGDFQMLESDVALVYFLWGEDEIDGELREIWTPLPLTLFEEEGILQYGYDFTINDVRLFITSNYAPATPNERLFEDWVVRVVVVPALFADTGRTGVDYSDYYSVAEHFGLETKPVDRKYTSIQRPEL